MTADMTGASKWMPITCAIGASQPTLSFCCALWVPSLRKEEVISSPAIRCGASNMNGTADISREVPRETQRCGSQMGRPVPSAHLHARSPRKVLQPGTFQHLQIYVHSSTRYAPRLSLS